MERQRGTRAGVPYGVSRNGEKDAGPGRRPSPRARLRGGDRQQLHEIIREASMQETAKMKNGESWDLVAQLAARPEFGMTAEEIRAELEPSRYIGRCPEQVAAMTSACRALIGADAQQAEELTL